MFLGHQVLLYAKRPTFIYKPGNRPLFPAIDKYEARPGVRDLIRTPNKANFVVIKPAIKRFD